MFSQFVLQIVSQIICLGQFPNIISLGAFPETLSGNVPKIPGSETLKLGGVSQVSQRVVVGNFPSNFLGKVPSRFFLGKAPKQIPWEISQTDPLGKILKLCFFHGIVPKVLFETMF